MSTKITNIQLYSAKSKSNPDIKSKYLLNSQFFIFVFFFVVFSFFLGGGVFFFLILFCFLYTPESLSVI